jgi:pyridoxal phosphate enzyme (YggS family)
VGEEVRMSVLAENYKRILEQVRELQCSLRQDPLTLIAVSKSQGIDALVELYHLGHRDFGENYAQELISKDDAFKARGLLDVRWHFIGHLQSNKVKAILPRVYAIHTVSSLKLAREISHRASQVHPALSKVPIFIEVNLHRESSKSGIHPEDVIPFVQEISTISGIELLGLMCVPDPQQDSAAAFQMLAELEIQCRPYTQGKLSMGMSSDFESAIQKGSTHIRLGTILFGKREF